MKNKDLIAISPFMRFLDRMNTTRTTDKVALPSDVAKPI
jgi:hypothetical protein